MPRVKVTHKNLTDEEAKKAPKRTPLPVGPYHAVIQGASPGTTNHKTPLNKVSVEFQVVAKIEEDDTIVEKPYQGRRVYQDYITEHSDDMPDISEIWRYELVSLLDAAQVDYDDEGFDTDDLLQKPVIVHIKHRTGDKEDDNGDPIIFMNVKKVESPEKVDEDELI